MSPSIFKQEGGEGAGAADGASQETSDTFFKKRRDEPPSISVFGAGIVVEGQIRGSGDIQIEGRVKGDIAVEGQVSVATRGTVEGGLSADRVVVAGTVNGSITAAQSLQLVAGARVDADITSPSLELQDGATLNGRVDMSGKTAAGRGSGADSGARSTSGSGSSGASSGGSGGSGGGSTSRSDTPAKGVDSEKKAAQGVA
jgi:cytoskeletal protein CcmA (bactofilin family)